MNIKSLNYFIEVAKEKSFTNASKNLFVCQSALSKAIKTFENELDITLIDRTSKHFKLTPEGQLLYENGVIALKVINEQLEMLLDSVSIEKGKIKVGVPPVISTIYFTSIIKSFKDNFHSINLQIIEAGANTVKDKVHNGEIDIGVVILNLKKSNLFTKALNDGANGAVIAILNTAAAVGFGGVVKIVPGFQTLTDLLLGLKASPLISEALAVTLLAGATGSSSGGMGIALEALAPQYIQIAATSGMNIEVFHRIATIASGGLDSLPHCGAVLTLLAVTKMTHKDSYNDIGMVTCVIPIVALVVTIILGMIGVV